MKAILPSSPIFWLGTSYRSVLAPTRPGCDPAIFESISEPGSGPPRHIHGREDETFYILSGDVDFWHDGETCAKGPGEAAFIPRGKEHSFRVIGERPARMLTILTPGGFEAFFAEMADKKFGFPDDMDKISQIGKRYFITFTGPPISVH